MKQILLKTTVFLTGIILLTGACAYRNHCLQQELAARVLRFHVIANSDDKKDQELKLKIRDRIGAYMQKELKDADSLEKCMEIVEKNQNQITACAKEVMAEEHVSYSVKTQLTKTDFPIKKYGNYIFPKGKYQALEVVIGEGTGQNWWCVMYPNMCFANSVYEVVDENAKEELKAVLTEEGYQELMAQGNVQVRFRYFEKLVALFKDRC